MTQPADSSHRTQDSTRDEHPAPVDERRRQTGMGAATGTMWRGGLSRSLLWGVVGAVVGLALGFVPWGDIPLWLRLTAFGVGGFLAGASAGFVYGAGRERDLDREARRETTVDTARPPYRS